ncbi:hypothetical protein [Beihai Nido-like virus 2]|uniref:Uncharacterized protein n=1 Tax=Beihai Nido-like virus 2 TaxID=1922351 RepID=A0A1L3KIT5_9NIDO|nr:hypothetical protein [Beihai Nido-like virus 2]APG77317.1 hypothetical protein [Beihai Nido-like virus 2]
MAADIPPCSNISLYVDHQFCYFLSKKTCVTLIGNTRVPIDPDVIYYRFSGGVIANGHLYNCSIDTTPWLYIGIFLGCILLQCTGILFYQFKLIKRCLYSRAENPSSCEDHDIITQIRTPSSRAGYKSSIDRKASAVFKGHARSKSYFSALPSIAEHPVSLDQFREKSYSLSRFDQRNSP